MIREIGTVTKLNQSSAIVSFKRSEEDCEDTTCKHCHLCEKIDDKQYLLLSADNSVSSKVGDKVLVESKEVNKVSAGFLIFILPLLIFIFSSILTELLYSKLYGVFIGIVLFVIWVIIVRIKLKKYKLKIIKIIN